MKFKGTVTNITINGANQGHSQVRMTGVFTIGDAPTAGEEKLDTASGEIIISVPGGLVPKQFSVDQPIELTL